MEKIAELPPLALVVFGFTLAVIFGIQRLGLLQGRKDAANPVGGGAQVVGITVDPSALNRATAAIEAFNMELINCRMTHTRSIDGVCRSIDNLTDQVDDLKKEIIRKNR